MGWGYSASLQFSAVRSSNELELTQKNWIEGNQKFIFQTQLDKRVWLILFIERSGAHKRKQVWNKIECLNFQLLMAGILLRTACPTGKLETFSSFFASTELHQTWTASNSFVRKSSIEISWIWWQFYLIVCLVWYAMLYTEPSLIAVLWL